MCLLIAGKSKDIRTALLDTAGLLANIFGRNKDGVGAMYVTSRKVLRTPKVLPKNLAECRTFIEAMPQDDRQLALHFRMKTHGDIDLENCHPYPVIEGKIAMMHNGVLSQGNHADRTKSDTWHYIADVVRPMLVESPRMFLNPAWLSLVEDDISRNNRFAIMDNHGDLSILNKDTGIAVQEMWFSNTYAWDPALLLPDYRKATTYTTGGMGNASFRGGYVGDNWRSGWEDDGGWGTPLTPATSADFRKELGKAHLQREQAKEYVETFADLLRERDEKDEKLGNGEPDPALVAAIRAEFETEEKALTDAKSVDFPFDEDELWEAVNNADYLIIGAMLDLYPYRTLCELYGANDFVKSDLDLEEEPYSVIDKTLVEKLVAGDVLFLVKFCSFTPQATTLLGQAIAYYGHWVAAAKTVDRGVSDSVMEAAAQELQEELALALFNASTGGEDGQVRPKKSRLSLVKQDAVWRGNSTPVVTTPSQLLAEVAEATTDALAAAHAADEVSLVLGAERMNMSVPEYKIWREHMDNIGPTEDQVLEVTVANVMQ